MPDVRMPASTPPRGPAHRAVALLTEIWQHIAAVCDDLDEEQWQLATAKSGWTVHDQVAHIAGTERSLDGELLPHNPAAPGLQGNEMDAFNDVWVEHYAGLTGAELLLEFGRVTTQRLTSLEQLTETDLQRETITPMGILSLGELLDTRVIDCFANEQDIRRALERPGHLDGDVARFAVDQALTALPKVVARSLNAPVDAVIVFDVDGSAGQRRAINISRGPGLLDRRTVSRSAGQGLTSNIGQASGWLLDHIPDSPTCVIDLDIATFLGLIWGRLTSQEAFDAALVGIEGDLDLARGVIGSMSTD